LAAVAVEGHVEGFDRAQPRVEWLEAWVERGTARLADRIGLEGVEVGRLVARWLVGAQLVEREIEECHGFLLSSSAERGIIILEKSISGAAFV
jgi:hypothetical protein